MDTPIKSENFTASYNIIMGVQGSAMVGQVSVSQSKIIQEVLLRFAVKITARQQPDFQTWLRSSNLDGKLSRLFLIGLRQLT